MISATCTAEHWLQLACAGFAALAAFTWFWASRVKAPISKEEMVARWDVPVPGLHRLIELATRQSRMNAIAALFAAAAAFCQVPLAFMPPCYGGPVWPFSN